MSEITTRTLTHEAESVSFKCYLWPIETTQFITCTKCLKKPKPAFLSSFIDSLIMRQVGFNS